MPAPSIAPAGPLAIAPDANILASATMPPLDAAIQATGPLLVAAAYFAGIIFLIRKTFELSFGK